MRLTLLLLTAACLHVSAGTKAQTITYQGTNVPLEKVFNAVRQQTGFVFFYNETLLSNTARVTIHATQVPLSQFLDLLVKDKDLKYTIVSKSIILSRASSAPAPPSPQPSANEPPPPIRPIRIRVVDAAGKPLAGASVIDKKNRHSGITDADGFLSLNVSEGDILSISFVGFQTNAFSITPAIIKTAEAASASTASGNPISFTIQLSPSTSPLDEMQVIAYGSTTRRLNTADVSTVKAEDIERQPVSNPMAALEGRVPGLLITQSSGVPGASFSVQIRGQNSILQGSDPLFVIDGVPFAPNNTSMSGLYSSVGTAGLSPLNTINPSDIASIEVLKDADATSIYGSRGANGVILITTQKKWKPGKAAVSANVYTGASIAPHTMNMMNTQQYLAMRSEALKNDGVTPDINSFPEYFAYDTTRYTDYKKMFLGGTAHTTDAQLALNGGSEGTQFLIGGGYHQESTIFSNTLKGKRVSFHSTITHTSQDKRLTANLSTSYTVDDNHLAEYSFGTALLTAPNNPGLYDSTGKVLWEQNGVPVSNPLLYLLQPYKSSNSNLIGSLQLSYRVLPGLTIKANLGYNMVRLDETQLTPVETQNPADYTTGAAMFSINVFKSWIVEPQAEYNRNISKGRLNILVGGTWQESINSATQINTQGITNDALLQSLSAATSITAFSLYNQYRYSAAFGRVGYTWNDKYIVNFTGRRDGSSRFGPGRQFAGFGAVGLAWIFTREAFAQHLPSFLSFGKLRGSYGSTGNDQIGDYQFLDSWTSPFYPYNGQAGLIPARLANANYSWEVNKKLEAALELGFLKDRILLNASYFYNRSGNQLISYTLPYQTGFTTITENLPAVVQNSGLELSANTKNIQSPTFTWTTSFNITIHRNKLVKFPGLATSSYANSYVIGKSLHVAHGFHYTGVNDTTGVFQFTDVNKDGAMNAGDYFIFGNLDPNFYGGLQNSLTYKNWNLDLFFQYRKQHGRSYLADVYSAGNFVPGIVNNNLPVSLLNRWRNPGDHTPFQMVTQDPGSAAYTAVSYFASSDGVYTDASFIRLKNVSLSYSLPASYIKRIGIQSCRLYAHIQNLLTITGYKGADPEVMSLYTLPPLKTFTAGIQITL